MNKYALITGASSGIGYEFAKILAHEGYNLIVVSRNTDKNLEKLAVEIGPDKDVVVIAEDLSKPGAAKVVFDSVIKEEIDMSKIEILINNAGFGDYGFFKDTDMEKENQMINLNIIALTELTKLFGREMVKNKYGKILNVASVAGFFPGPLMSVYFATKAYVLSFSQAIANEFKDDAVSVTVLCPGPTKSNFGKFANWDSIENNSNIPTSKEVAEFGYKEMMKGTTIAVHGMRNKLQIYLAKFFPKNLVTKIIRQQL